MCEVIVFIPKRSGAAAGYAEKTAAPLRQPVEAPVSQCVRLGEVTRYLLEKLEQRMSENAITKA